MPRTDDFRGGLAEKRGEKRKEKRFEPLVPVSFSGDIRFQDNTLALISFPRKCRLSQLTIHIPFEFANEGDFRLVVTLIRSGFKETVFDRKLSVGVGEYPDSISLEPGELVFVSAITSLPQEEIQKFPFSISYLVQLKDGR